MKHSYTPLQRQGIAFAFKQAKAVLWDGGKSFPDNNRQFICNALVYVKDIAAISDAREIIAQRLGGCPTVFAYLNDRVPESRRQLTDRNVQTFRHLWLDSLIKEFSE